MKITALIENTSRLGLPVEHGLSLYIVRADGRRVLFDMGQGRLFADNAARLGLPIAEVDTAVISHGHYDHGGGLAVFLEENAKARVYVHRTAFEPHYSLRENGLRHIGLDPSLEASDRLVRCGAVQQIDDSATLFSNVTPLVLPPHGNRLLFGPDRTVNDAFGHEQSLIIKEGSHVVLFAGCAHTGIVNILRRAEEVAGYAVTHVFAGMHLVKSGLDEERETAFINALAERLADFPTCRFHTMHCTGEAQYARLCALPTMAGRMEYLSCGDTVCLG